MNISRIELCNFGSYAGLNIFDIGSDNDKSIVLIGGKNGAGKTTLFSGIKLCLYGHKAEGFQGVNSFYRKEIKKYFNDISKYEAASSCYTKISFFLSNGHADDYYEIKREWNISAKVLSEFEKLEVKKNGVGLSEEELADFENFLLNLIPPELFNLFFFDGEQIADYFLDDSSNQHLKNAFMMLCGFDTLDIMEKNFKRIIYGRKNNDDIASEYLAAKERVSELKSLQNENNDKLEDINDQIDSLDAEIEKIEKVYKLSGGVSYEEWNELQLKIKEEEILRENTKAYLKKMANEVIPFIIVKPLLLRLKEQIINEKEKQQFEILQKSLKSMLPEVMTRVYNRLEWQDDEELTQFVLEEFDNEANSRHVNDVNYILDLSSKDASNLQVVVDKYLAFNNQEIIDLENTIDKSLKRTQKLRKKLEQSRIDDLQEFINNKNNIIEKKTIEIEKQQDVLKNIATITAELVNAELALKREEKRFEEQIKYNSVNELAEKSIAFLGHLQNQLYHKKIKLVEDLFMNKIKQLARKTNFIDKISIDEEFNIHVYKQVEFNAKVTAEKILEIGYGQYIDEYGLTHAKALLEATGVVSLEEFVSEYKETNKAFSVLQEIDKSRLSKGEKQIFIMSLYWAFMRLSKYEIPFIIDTPFARIDSEHRANITKEFFMDLHGQVFIFSTNEEIVGIHYDAMKDGILATFLLENIDNVRTNIMANTYFGGEADAI